MPESSSPSPIHFALQVESLYQALMQSATARGKTSLGGKLLYAGELDADGRALLVAANIAGAASLAATANPAAQKQAIRDGVADFLVTSLDEALRILKNEIRKRETVAVCIAAEPDVVEREMRERGVVPDLPRIAAAAPLSTPVHWWQVAATPAQWLSSLDKIALDCLTQTAVADLDRVLRWLRQSPRYLGRMASGTRVLRCEIAVARMFAARVESAVREGNITVAVEMHLGTSSSTSEENFRFSSRPADAR